MRILEGKGLRERNITPEWGSSFHLEEMKK